MSSDSPKTLVNKLSFEPGDTIFVESTPDWYSDFADQHGLELTPGLPATHVHLFCENKAALEQFLKEEDLSDIEKSLWLSWPKKSSGVKTDINEQDFRDLVLPLGWPGRRARQPGWVDTKVAAIDDTWSGLKFVRRKKTK